MNYVMALETMDNHATFYIVRHGETEMNRKLQIQGHGDSPLSVEGERQAQERAAMLRDAHFDHACCSDLLRARRTAEIILSGRPIALHATEALRERHFGSYEGRSIHEFLDDNHEFIEQFVNLPDEERWKFQLLGGVETNEHALDRTVTYLQETARTQAGKNILTVTHAGVMRLLLVRLGWGTHEELPWGTIANCGMMILHSNGTDFIVHDVEGIQKSTARRSVHVIL